jgi:hypothetical protein
MRDRRYFQWVRHGENIRSVDNIKNMNHSVIIQNESRGDYTKWFKFGQWWTDVSKNKNVENHQLKNYEWYYNRLCWYL